MIAWNVVSILGCILLLSFGAVGINSLVVAAARKYQRTNGFCWVVAHAWQTNIVGFAVAAAAGWVLMASWLDAKADRPYIPPPEEPAVTSTWVAVDIDYSDRREEEEVEWYEKQREAHRWAAAAIWLEARGEMPQGRVAVATVLWNRAKGNPTNFVAVLQSTNWLGSPQILDPNQVDLKDPIYREASLLADDMIWGKFVPLAEWTHFYNPSKVSPPWGTQLAKRKTVGNHVFGVLP